MFFAVIAKDHPGKTDLRAQTKTRHTAHLDAAAEGLRVLQTGPLLDESGAEVGFRAQPWRIFWPPIRTRRQGCLRRCRFIRGYGVAATPISRAKRRPMRTT
jgi:hypothetical protein